MKLQLSASRKELREKSSQLVKAISALLSEESPELADQLLKALPRKEVQLKYPVLRAIQNNTNAMYAAQVEAMLKDIGKVLDQAAATSRSTPVKEPVREVLREPVKDHTKAIADKDAKAYNTVIKILEKVGYKRSDFDIDGPLYGWSTNQLLDLAKEKAVS